MKRIAIISAEVAFLFFVCLSMVTCTNDTQVFTGKLRVLMGMGGFTQPARNIEYQIWLKIDKEHSLEVITTDQTKYVSIAVHDGSVEWRSGAVYEVTGKVVPTTSRAKDFGIENSIIATSIKYVGEPGKDDK